MPIKEFVESIGRNWDLLNRLYDAEFDENIRKECYLSGLSNTLGKKTSFLSPKMKDLEKQGLLFSQAGETNRRKYFKLTPNSKNVMEALLNIWERRERVEEIVEPDKEQLDFLLNSIKEGNSEKLREIALKDLTRVCKRTKVWKLDRLFSDFIDKGLEEIDGLLGNAAMDCLMGIILNLNDEGEGEKFRSIKEKYFKRLKEKYKENLWNKSLNSLEKIKELLKMMGDRGELIETYKETVEGLIKKGKLIEWKKEEGRNYLRGILNHVENLLSMGLKREEKNELMKWMYRLMSSRDLEDNAILMYEFVNWR